MRGEMKTPPQTPPHKGEGLNARLAPQVLLEVRA
jgi:hypothetical protein